MLDFLADIGLATVLEEITPGGCHLPRTQSNLPLHPDQLTRLLSACATPPIVHPLDGGGYGVIFGAPFLAAAEVTGLSQVRCAVVTTPLSAGVCEFLHAAGEMHAGASLPPVLWAQVLWLIFFWANAQSLYLACVREEPERPITSPLVFTAAAADIDALCAGIENYLRTYFSPPSEYIASSSRIAVPWNECLAPFSHVPSETKRKTLLRLLAMIPPDLRAEFRKLECPVSLLRALAALPPETMRRALATLTGAPPRRQRDILRQLKQAGILTTESGGASSKPRPPSGTVADAFPAETVAEEGTLAAPTFHGIVQGLNRANLVLQRLPPSTRLTDRQRQALWLVSMQLWDLLEPLLDGGRELK